MSIAEKISSLTDAQIRDLAKKTGRSYLDTVKELERMKKQSLYYKSDVAKAAAKRYREKAKARKEQLKSLL